jgi:hypothetical protein
MGVLRADLALMFSPRDLRFTALTYTDLNLFKKKSQTHKYLLISSNNDLNQFHDRDSHNYLRLP